VSRAGMTCQPVNMNIPDASSRRPAAGGTGGDGGGCATVNRRACCHPVTHVDERLSGTFARVIRGSSYSEARGEGSAAPVERRLGGGDIRREKTDV
jgi:hypothetical protein